MCDFNHVSYLMEVLQLQNCVFFFFYISGILTKFCAHLSWKRYRVPYLPATLAADTEKRQRPKVKSLQQQKSSP